MSIVTRCVRCGCPLEEENRVPVSTKWMRDGYSPICVDCQEDYYDNLASKEGHYLALFHLCAAINVPCLPAILEGVDLVAEKTPWILYLNKLQEKKKNIVRNRVQTFFDGETNILRIFGREMTEKDFGKAILAEHAKVKDMVGLPEQHEKWGDGPPKNLYTARDFNDLDRMYDNRMASYSGQTITPQMEDVIKNVCVYDLEAQRAVNAGNAKKAKELYDIIDKLLASELLRKKDEKPVEAYSLDSQVVALERAGLMEKGKFPALEPMQQALLRLLQRKKYGYSIDVADHSLEAIHNTMRKNADLFIPLELPEELKMEDEFGEFEPEETEEERENKRFAGMVSITYEKSDLPEQ